LDADIDAVILKKAFSEVVRRHEALRTTFNDVDGHPRQVVHPFREEYHGLVILDDLEDPLAHISGEMDEVFDLKKGPLFRSILYRSDTGKAYLYGNFHHIIVDGFSVDILLKEWLVIYRALLEGKSSPLRELTIQYKDYAHWMTEYLASPEAQRDKNYWIDRMTRLPERIVIPPDLKRGDTMDFRGDSVIIDISQEQTEQLKATSRQRGATLFMTILSLIKMLINKQAGDGNVVVGCPYSGRFTEALSDQVGFFVNHLALADVIAGTDTFDDILIRVRSTVLDASRHQLYPYDSLVAAISPERQLTGNLLYDIDVNMNDQDLGNFTGIDPGTMGLKEMNIKPKTAKFDLSFSIYSGSGLSILLEYKTGLYDLSTVSLMKRRLQNIAAAIAEGQTDVPISHLDWDKGVIPEAMGIFEKEELF
jgi:condensation domain-containing protein